MFKHIVKDLTLFYNFGMKIQNKNQIILKYMI